MKDDLVLLSHGAGGRAGHDLVRDHILAKLANRYLDSLADGAVVPEIKGRLAMTTDSFIVDPLFFPNENIGGLAITGTVNDLAVMGAEPLFLSLGLIIEEGLPFADLDRIVDSIAREAGRQDVLVVTGDTKVLPKGKGDGIFINTTGIGRVDDGWSLGTEKVRPGDRIIVSGDIGRHGATIMASRKGMSLSSTLTSDVASLKPLVETLFKGRQQVRFMRDPTRGGLATVLRELAEAADVGVVIDESSIPLDKNVAAVCEILGLDPLYLACEGRLTTAVAPEFASEAIELLKTTSDGAKAAIIGEVTDHDRGMLVARTAVGGEKILDMLTGDPMPRIC
jgi:hydrogenase expression/formation protein HypE